MAESASSSQKSQKRLNEFLDELIRPAECATQEWNTLWQDGMNYVFFNQLSNASREGWDRIEVNRVFPTVQQELSILTQRNPIIAATPWEPMDRDAAAIWSKHFQWLWEKSLNMPLECAYAALDAKIYGYFVWKPYWEPRLEWDEVNEQWNGGVQVTLIHPAAFGVDPEAERIDHASYMFSSRRVLTSWAVKTWPSHKDAIINAARQQIESDIPGGNTTGFYARENQTETLNLNNVDPADGRLANILWRNRRLDRVPKEARSLSGGMDYPRYVTLQEVFWRDDDAVERSLSEPVPREEAGIVQGANGKFVWSETGQAVTDWPRRESGRQSVPKFPFGRYVMRVGSPGNWMTLNGNEKDQVWMYRTPCYTVGVNGLLPHSWQGLNSVEPVRKLQDWTNTTMAQMTNAVKNFGDPRVVVEQGALIDDPELENTAEELAPTPGKIIKVAAGRGDGVRTLEGANLPPGAVELFGIIGQSMRDMLGMQDVGLGQPTAKKETATEIARREANSRMRTALQSFLLDDAIVRLFNHIAELCHKNYRPEQVIRVVGEGMTQTVMQMDAKLVDARYDLSLRVGTALPFDMERKRQELMELYQGGIQVLPELLDTYDFDNKDEILQRQQDWASFQQYMEQKAAVDQQLSANESRNMPRAMQAMQATQNASAQPAPGRPMEQEGAM